MCQNNSGNLSDEKKYKMSRQNRDSEREEKTLFLKFNNGRQYNAEIKEMSGEIVKLQFGKKSEA